MSHIKTWNVEVRLFEDGDVTKATAVLTGRHEVRATGAARRHPQDAAVPEIGDELATARALSALAHQLLEAAALDIESVTHKPAHLRS